VLVTAVVLSPVGARLTPHTDPRLLLGLFTAFLFFAGFMMLFYRTRLHARPIGRGAEMSLGAGVGAGAGFLGGLLGVGGGNFILPVLAWLGIDTKVAAGTTALVVVFASLSGFLAHATGQVGQEIESESHGGRQPKKLLSKKPDDQRGSGHGHRQHRPTLLHPVWHPMRRLVVIVAAVSRVGFGDCRASRTLRRFGAHTRASLRCNMPLSRGPVRQRPSGWRDDFGGLVVMFRSFVSFFCSP